MASRTQDAAGYYVWDAPGQPVAIHLHLDVLDRLATEAMRGFGAVPKRGAEVGGVLLGTFEPGRNGHPAMVRVEDFESVACQYERGPSYQFSDEGKAVFADAVRRQADSSSAAYAVGYYRSHTREGMSLAPEDIEILDKFFPGAENIALLVKPHGTKVSDAGFFVRQDGGFPETTPLEFPFRRRELTGEEPPPHRPLMERRPRRGEGRDGRAPAPASTEESTSFREESPRYRDAYEEPQPTGPAAAGHADATSLSRSRFPSSVWVPLSIIFLACGILLGIMISLGRATKVSSDPQDFALGLSVSRSGDNLSVKWDSHAPAIQASPSGRIEIEENGTPISKDLDTAQLHNGGMIYTNSSNTVKFRLTVFPKGRVSVSETAEWRP